MCEGSCSLCPLRPQDHITYEAHVTNPSADCVVRLTITAPVRAGGNRVKVVGVALMQGEVLLYNIKV